MSQSFFVVLSLCGFLIYAVFLHLVVENLPYILRTKNRFGLKLIRQDYYNNKLDVEEDIIFD